ncbi:hypothetical protein PanWU01x14_083910, partial [Parasponia andersonii]
KIQNLLKPIPLRIPTNQRVPRNQISFSHFIKHFLCRTQFTTRSIHMNQSISNKKIRLETKFQSMNTNLLAMKNIRNSSTSLENIDKGQVVPNQSLAKHTAIHVHCFTWLVTL